MNIVVLAGIVITVLTMIPVLIQLRNHPRGLFVLFFAEMWERFSYYGMRGLLIFYLTQHFLFDDSFASGQYASYTTLVYLVPLLGGFLADRWLGARKATVFGALLLVAGHSLMAVEGPAAVQTLTYAGHVYAFQAHGLQGDYAVCLKVAQGCYAVAGAPGGALNIVGLPTGAPLPVHLAAGSFTQGVSGRSPLFVDVFYLALSLIIMGVGYLKANISAIVGQLYPAGDPRRDAGFTLYYYGVNLGAFWAAILCGLIGQTVGWWAGFGLAGIGMAFGLIVFVLGKPLLEGKGEPPSLEALKRKVIGPLRLEPLLYLVGIVGVWVVWMIVSRFALMGWLLGAGWVFTLGYFAFVFTKIDRVQRDRLLLAMALLIGCIVFFTLFEQAGSSLNQFAARNTVLPNSGALTITAAQVQSFNAGFILIFAPIFALMWAWLGKIGRDPNPALKFGLGLIQVGAGFLVLVLSARFADAQFRVPLFFLTAAYLLHTTGELWLSPVGMSEMTKLAPAALISTLLAMWFLATSAAQFLAGVVAKMTASDTLAGQVLDPAKALAVYLSTFQLIGLIGIGFGLAFVALSPFLKRLAHGAGAAAGDHHPALATDQGQP